jgi:antitoxin ParD1/3/4
MPKTLTLELDDHFRSFVERQVENGEYGSTDEVLKAGLSLLEERQAKLEALRAALIEGEQSGPATPFDFDEFLAEMNREHSGSN